MNDRALGASFRDRSGFVFERDGVLYRQVDRSYAEHYDHLMSSGLYDALADARLLIPHEEVLADASSDGSVHRTLRPERVPFVAYPYEWCFGQYRDAALATLRIQRMALQFGMTLKDASSYNIQFHEGLPILIDTLSFERYNEGSPWVAYRQFCQHFLAPLALMARRDVRLGQLMRVYIDGVPLDLATSLLPWRTWSSFQLLLHLRLHARFQRRYASDADAARKVRPLSRKALGNLIDGLEHACSGLDWEPQGTEWADYDADESYSDESNAHKFETVAGYLDRARPQEVWDLGANTGRYSRLACERGARTLAFDLDPAAAERCYRQMRRNGERQLLPLVLDLANPSPALGWAHAERSSLAARSSADLVLALALLHHLAISNNLPLERIAAFFAELAPQLIVEFVPKSDPQCERLLAGRVDVFPDYQRAEFEREFHRYFDLEEATQIRGSERTLYRMRRRAPAAAC